MNLRNIYEFIKNLIIITYIILISYLITINDTFSSKYDIPYYTLPIIFYISILSFIYDYIKIYIANRKIEDEFTSIVNHTFRTPLTRIMWFTGELEKEIEAKDRIILTQNINNSTKRVLDIVDLFVGIKNINDKSSYFFKAESIRNIVENSMLKYREEINKKNLKFEVDTFKEIPLITVDLKKISFVFDTIIENALFYTEKNGEVKIEADFKNKILILKVSDNGIGFSFFESLRMFSKFYRTKKAILMNPDGMGLKLYLAKQIIKKHKGNMYIYSKGKNKGSTLFLRLHLS